ncbi:MAG: glycosyltransferase [Christensenellales bacterium]
MKKILISIRDLNIGGVQRSLIELLNQLEPEINSNKYKITLLVLNPDGPLNKLISKNVEIITPNKLFKKFGLSNNEAKQKNKFIYLKRSITAVWCKVFSNKLPIKCALKKQIFLGDYDVAISYAMSISDKSMYAGWSELILEKCNAKNKVVYIHNDYVNSGLNNSNSYKLLSRFDNIWFVSKSCEKSFLNNFGEFAGKTQTLYNFVDSKSIILKSNDQCDVIRKEGLNIISVSRLSEEKGYLRTLDAIKKLYDNNFSFFWHIIGDGPQKETIKKKVVELGLQNVVKLYGEKSNPYPYIKQCDMLMLNSYNESFGLTLIESMLLGVPVFTTNTISAKEVVGSYGVVCENSLDGIYHSLENILQKPKQINDFKTKLENYYYDNTTIKEKLKSLL